MAIGTCVSGKSGPCGSENGDVPGYGCDSTLQHCCPTVNTTDTDWQIGPSIGGMCPVGYTSVYGLPSDIYNNGVCIDLNSVPYSK